MNGLFDFLNKVAFIAIALVAVVVVGFVLLVVTVI